MSGDTAQYATLSTTVDPRFACEKDLVGKSR